MHIVRLPRLGQTMESGIITLWCVEEGASFAIGDPLYEVETDKMNTEVEAKQDGVLVRIIAPSGNLDVPVGAVLAVIAAPHEVVDEAAIDELLASGPAVVVEDEDEPAPDAEATSEAQPAHAPEPPVVVEAPEQGSVLAVPKARALAKSRGIDLAEVEGSGENGVIRVLDVVAASKARDVATPVCDVSPPPAPARVASQPALAARPAADGYVGEPRVSARIPVRGVARSMAETMARSWPQVPQFVQQISLDATALAARLKRLRYEGLAVTYTDLLVSAVAQTAVEVPQVNASFAGDEIVQYHDVNVSIAVATDRGLLVPVVRQASTLAIAEVAATTRSLAERGREGQLTSDDMSGGTITVSNLGAFGIDTGTPIVNAPQCAIVFVGSLGEQAVVLDGALAVQLRLNVAIAYDHRVVDGMAAAAFTSALKKRLEAGG
jgi:pyruvate dehydrogenase E2 component (dihydrolipoamide acetyltransferase)